MLARTPSGDIKIPMSVVTDPATLAAQNLSDSLNLWLGSWSFDTSQGMPWLQSILVKNPNLTRIRMLFRSAILSVPRVVSVDALSFSYDRKTRNLSYYFESKIDTGIVVQGGAGPAFAPQ